MQKRLDYKKRTEILKSGDQVRMDQKKVDFYSKAEDLSLPVQESWSILKCQDCVEVQAFLLIMPICKNNGTFSE